MTPISSPSASSAVLSIANGKRHRTEPTAPFSVFRQRPLACTLTNGVAPLGMLGSSHRCISICQPVQRGTYLVRDLNACHRPEVRHDLQKFSKCDYVWHDTLQS